MSATPSFQDIVALMNSDGELRLRVIPGAKVEKLGIENTGGWQGKQSCNCTPHPEAETPEQCRNDHFRTNKPGQTDKNNLA